jgi:hypothetical protein
LRDLRALRRQQYEAAKEQCQRLGLPLGYWEGDEEFDSSLPSSEIQTAELPPVDPEPIPEAPRLVLIPGGKSLPAAEPSPRSAPAHSGARVPDMQSPPPSREGERR